MSSVDKPVRWVQVCLNAAQRKVSVWPDVPPRCLQTCFPSLRNFRCEAIAVLHSVLCEENKLEINSFFVLLSVVLAACWWFLFLPRRCFGRLRRLTDRKHTYTSVGTLSGTDVRWHRLCPPWGMTSLSPRLCVCVCVFHSITFLGLEPCVSLLFPSCALESCSAAAGGTKTTAALLA